ncbi:MAG: tetratricopeptide repeat protein [Pirellulaceae bacterium]
MHTSQALQLIRELHEHFPANSDYHADLLVTATEADFRLPAEERISKLQNCLSELKRLSEQHPNRTDYFGLVCRFQSLLGNLFANIDQLDQAEASFQESLRAMDAFANRFPEVTREEDMATEYMKVGSLSLQLGKYQAALDTQETAVEYFRSLADSQPANPFFTSKLSSNLKRLGMVHSRLGNLSAAAACYQESLTLAKQLAQAHPDEAEYHGKIVRRQWLQAMLMLEQQDFVAAADVFFELQQSVAILSGRFPDYSEPTLTALEVDAWMVNAIVQPPSPKWDQAASILLQRWQIVQQKQDSASEILVLMRISDLYVETDDLDAANEYLDQAWQVIRSLSATQRSAAQRSAAQSNSSENNASESNAELRIRLAEMQWMLARRLAWIGRTAESAKLSNELLAAASDPKLLSATVNGLAAYPLANPAQLQQVEQILAHTLEKQPQLNAFGLMGATLVRLNQPDKAISMLESALSKPEGRTAVHLYYAAMCSKLLERHDQAEQWLAEADRKAIFHDPLRRLEIIRLQQQAHLKPAAVE